MSRIADAFVGDLGNTLPFTALLAGGAVNLTGATLTALHVRKPDGTSTSYTTGLTVVSAALGTYERAFASDTSDFDIAGTWWFQLRTTEGLEVKRYDWESQIVGERA